MSIDFTDVPPGVNIDDNQQASLYGAYISTFSLAVISVGLRFLCRLRLSRAGLGWDDWLVLGGLTMALGQFIAMLYWIKGGLGMHIYVTGYEGFSTFLSTLFGIEILYTLSIMLTKYSILAFYWRIFGAQNIKIPTLVLGPIITCWGIGVILTTIFQCTPVRGFWDKTIMSTCGVDTDEFFIGNAIPNIITDWSLLILPVPFLWRLQRGVAQKIALVGVFALGGFICIISIIRLAVMLDAYKVPSIDLTWVFIGPSTWTAVEVNIGIVSACLPSLRPVLTACFGGLKTQVTGRSSTAAGGGGLSGTNNNASNRYSAGVWSKSRRSMFLRNADTLVSGNGSDINLSDAPYAHGINVKTTVDIHAESKDNKSSRTISPV